MSVRPWVHSSLQQDRGYGHCRLYRYWLVCGWSRGKGFISNVWILINQWENISSWKSPPHHLLFLRYHNHQHHHNGHIAEPTETGSLPLNSMMMWLHFTWMICLRSWCMTSEFHLSRQWRHPSFYRCCWRTGGLQPEVKRRGGIYWRPSAESRSGC